MPSFFSASKENAQFRSAFAAAGLDADAFLKANSDQFLKTALANAAANAPKSDAVAAAEETVAEAVKENGKLNAQITSLTTANASALALVKAATTFAGVEAATPEALTKALDAKVTKGAVNIVAAAGHPGVDEHIEAATKGAPGKPKSAAGSGVEGIARVEASLKARRTK